MAIEIWAEILAWALHALGALAAAALVALWRWLRRLERELADLRSERASASDVSAVREGLATLQCHLAENYIRRDDWIPAVSRVLGMLEGHTEMLGRLDERTSPR